MGVIDLVGQRFGRLVVLERDYEYPKEHNIKSKQAYWKCQCDCDGKIISVAGQSLRKGITLSCGCFGKEESSKRQKKNLTGQRFNRLVVIEEVPKKQNNTHTVWKCQCDCGNIVEIPSDKLLSGNTQSCGCLMRENRKVFYTFYATNVEDISQKRFGRLMAIAPTSKRSCGSVIWDCKCDCGNEIQVARNHLITGNTQSCGCLNSIGESQIQSLLQENNILFEKQKIFEDCINPQTQQKLRYDFYLPDCNRLIEFDGEQHYQVIEYFGGKEKLLQQQELDKIKNEYALSHGIDLVRIPYWKKNKITLDLLLGKEYLIDNNE